jgi:hypothetical protein
MKQIATQQLTGAALDWAVAACENVECDEHNKPIWFGSGETRIEYTPSTNWAQGGPIIERENITLIKTFKSGFWTAYLVGDTTKDFGKRQADGDTPLIAAMRCYVASKLGGKVDVPRELI